MKARVVIDIGVVLASCACCAFVRDVMSRGRARGRGAPMVCCFILPVAGTLYVHAASDAVVRALWNYKNSAAPSDETKHFSDVCSVRSRSHVGIGHAIEHCPLPSVSRYKSWRGAGVFRLTT